MRKAVLSLTDLTASKRIPLTLLAACLAGMVVLFGVGIKSAETQTTAPSYYQVQDLGTLGGSYSFASALNDSGRVVGYSYTAGDQNWHAFLYDASATPKMKDLGTLGGSESEAKAINKSGQVVGSSYNSSGYYHAFLYDSANGMKDLNDLIPADSGWSIGEATAINTDSKIAATGWPAREPGPCYEYAEQWDFDTALLLTPASTATYEVQSLGTLGGDFSYARGINGSGQVVGYSGTSNCYGQSAFLYDASATPKMQDLGGAYSEASGINGSGKVVGHTENWDLYDQCTNLDCWRAFLYDASTTPNMQDLGTLGSGATYGTFGSEATGINDSGKVVGMSGMGDGQHHWVSGSGPTYGFIYDSTNGMINLNTLISADSGWTISSASAISTDGKIAANGHKDGVGSHALLLTPTSDSPPDSQAPSAPTVSSPQNNTYDSDGSFSVSGSSEAASTVELFEGTTSKGTTKADSSSGAWSIPLSGVSEGSHTYSAKAKDAAGNTSPASNSVTVTVDKTAPKVNTLTATSVTSTGVPLRKTDFKATFSEKMNTPTLNTSTFKLFKCSSTTSTTCTTQITNAPVTPSGDGLSATLNPFGSKSTSLQASTRYKVVVTTSAKDVAGNALDQNASTTGNQQKVGYFTTGSS